MGLARRNLDCCRAGAGADHGAQVRAALVFRPVGVVDEVVDRLDRLERDFLRQAGGSDPPRLLPHRGPVPRRVLPVVRTHIESVVDRYGPNPRWGAIRLPVLTERWDVQVIGLSNARCYAYAACTPIVRLRLPIAHLLHVLGIPSPLHRDL